MNVTEDPMERLLMKLRKHIVILDVLSVAVIIMLLSVGISEYIHKKYWGAIVDVVLIAVNVIPFYSRHRKQRQCRTCGYFVVPPGALPLDKVSKTIAARVNPGMCLISWDWQLGDILHKKSCWKKPEKVKESTKIQAWNEYLFEQKIESKDW